MTQENNTQAAIDAGKEIATAQQIAKLHDGIPFLVKSDGGVVVLEALVKMADQRAPQPRELAGRATLRDDVLSRIAEVLKANREPPPIAAHIVELLAKEGIVIGVGTVRKVAFAKKIKLSAGGRPKGIVEEGPRAGLQERRDRALELWARGKGASVAEIARQTGLTRQTIYNYIRDGDVKK